jgi:hypothetical protein
MLVVVDKYFQFSCILSSMTIDFSEVLNNDFWSCLHIHIEISKLNWFFVGDMSRLYLKDFSIQLQGIKTSA